MKNLLIKYNGETKTAEEVQEEIKNIVQIEKPEYVAIALDCYNKNNKWLGTESPKGYYHIKNMIDNINNNTSEESEYFITSINVRLYMID